MNIKNWSYQSEKCQVDLVVPLLLIKSAMIEEMGKINFEEYIPDLGIQILSGEVNCYKLYGELAM